MNQFIPYVCKVCRGAGMVEYEDEGLDGRDFSEWKDILCHDRCSDFAVLKMKETRALISILTWLSIKIRTDSESERVEVREKARKALVDATKRFCTAVTKYYRKPPAWEPDLSEAILATPEASVKLLNAFEARYRK